MFWGIVLIFLFVGNCLAQKDVYVVYNSSVTELIDGLIKPNTNYTEVVIEQKENENMEELVTQEKALKVRHEYVENYWDESHGAMRTRLVKIKYKEYPKDVDKEFKVEKSTP